MTDASALAGPQASAPPGTQATAPSGTKASAPSGRRRRKMQQVTMNEVAALAQVSPSTVSLYLRKPSLVSPAAGADIARAIERLGYVPNLVAGGLAAAGSRVVSIIVPSVRNAFFADTVAALQDGLAGDGLQLMLGHTEYDPAREESLVRAALSWSPAAVVLVGLTHSRAVCQLLLATPIPVFEIWERGPNPIDTVVGFYHRDVGMAAAHHLIDRGRMRLAFLGARLQDDHRARQRAEGFQRAATDRGLAPPLLLTRPEPAGTAAGAALLRRLIDEHGDIDGVACSNDLVALGVLFECQRQAIAVPDRLAVMGFGDMEFATACTPPLTSIRPHGAQIGATVAQLILRRLAGGESAPEHRVVDTGFSLLARASTGGSAAGCG